MAPLAGRYKWDAVKRLFALVSGGTLMALAVLSLLSCLTKFWDPLAWMAGVWAVWMFLFGLLIMLLQLNSAEGTITHYFGFLDLSIGRGLFYLFCGNCGSGMAKAEGDQHGSNVPLVIVAWALFGMCWVLGFAEMCGPRSREPKRASAPAPQQQSGLRASLCPNESTAGGEPSIRVNFTPNQAAQAATFAANNVTPEQAAAGARFAASHSESASVWASKVAQMHPTGGYGRE